MRFFVGIFALFAIHALLQFTGAQETAAPTETPTELPTQTPTVTPTYLPTEEPTDSPSETPSTSPTYVPSVRPTYLPTAVPTFTPSTTPTYAPTEIPTYVPTDLPTETPSINPTYIPSAVPTYSPTDTPSTAPTYAPTEIPTYVPTDLPTETPSINPTYIPSAVPTYSPTDTPSAAPTYVPSAAPTYSPTNTPSAVPTYSPTDTPSADPTYSPTDTPSAAPTYVPSAAPTYSPTDTPTFSPSFLPSTIPSFCMTSIPTVTPSCPPSLTVPRQPILLSTMIPSSPTIFYPSSHPSLSYNFDSTFSTRPFSIINGSTNFKEILFPFGVLQSTGSPVSDVVFNKNMKGGNFIIFGSRTSNLGNIQVQNAIDLHYGISLDSVARSINSAGDLNGDGYKDMVIGDPLNSIVYVFFGTRSGWKDLSDGFYIFGETKNDYLGWAVSSAGDFNGDGLDDLLLGTLINRCYVIYGQKDGYDNIYLSKLTANEGLTILLSDAAYNSLGISLSGLGDWNGDGLKDIAMTALGNNGANMIFVLYGNSTFSSSSSSTSASQTRDLSSLLWYEGLQISAPIHSFAGISVSSLGNVNGDGYDDMVIGSVPYSSGYTTQISYVIYGRSSALSFTIDLKNLGLEDGFTITGGGIVVSGPGDLNGDGCADIIVTSFMTWQGQSSSYIIQYPSKATPEPTTCPSSIPSILKFPTLLPSRLPSSTPSMSPAVGTHPTYGPTVSATGPSLPPTVSPSSPTVSPTITPTTRRPSPIPTRNPTFNPSKPPTLKPTLNPTATFAPSITPSYIRTSHPSNIPTIRPTSTVPTTKPTVSVSSPVQVVVIGTRGRYTGNSTNQVFIIQSANNSIITGGAGMKRYVIYPEPNATLTITDFNSNIDVLDLSNFPSYVLQGSYDTNPLVLILPNNQRIILSSHQTYDLLPESIIYPASSSQSSSTSSSSSSSFSFSSIISNLEGTLSTEIIELIAILGGLLLFSFLCVNQLGKCSGSSADRAKKEKIQRIMKKLNALTASGSIEVVVPGNERQSFAKETNDMNFEDESQQPVSVLTEEEVVVRSNGSTITEEELWAALAAIADEEEDNSDYSLPDSFISYNSLNDV